MDMVVKTQPVAGQFERGDDQDPRVNVLTPFLRGGDALAMQRDFDEEWAAYLEAQCAELVGQLELIGHLRAACQEAYFAGYTLSRWS